MSSVRSDSRPVLVVGFGITGRAVAAYYRARGQPTLVVEDTPGPRTSELASELGAELVERPTPEQLAEAVAGCSLVVPSPGVAIGHPVFELATAARRPVRSEIELAYRALELRAAPRPRLVSITGTNGKTTVTSLVAAMLEASGCRVLTAGNIGRPLLDAVGADVEVVVAEVSSFQLQLTERFRPAVSCWLNLSADHLDWHPDMGQYAAAKARIWANQGAGDVAVYNLDDPLVSAAAAHVSPGVHTTAFHTTTFPTTTFPTTALRPAATPANPDADSGHYRLEGDELVAPDGQVLVSAGELPRALPHDLANSLAAAAVAIPCGASLAGVRSALRHTAAPAHRVELIAESAGVRWYDDSKATTPASVLAAVAGFDSVVLIAGGRNKGLDLRGLAATVPPVRGVVAIGEAGREVEEALATRVPVHRAETMEDAVKIAASLADHGDAVILSPGCASFDWYASYGQRGDHFAAAVHRMLEDDQMLDPDQLLDPDQVLDHDRAANDKLRKEFS